MIRLVTYITTKTFIHLILTIMKANLNELPETVQTEVKELLKWFPIAHIDFNNGKFSVSPNIGLSNKYAEDQKYYGSVNNTDIYTQQEIDEFIKQM